MAARDAPDGRRRSEDQGRTRAPAGGARFFRRHGRVIVAAVAFVLIGLAALRGSGDQGTDRADDERTDDVAADNDPVGEAATSGSTVDDAATTAPDTTLVPPDVAHDSPAIDLAVVPDGHEPVEAARWWAANYAAYVGAEGPGELADRLAPLTGSGLLQSLRDIPPAASYDAPLQVLGAVGNAAERGAGSVKARVSIDTELGLVIYDVTLTEAPPGSWLVSRADRVT